MMFVRKAHHTHGDYTQSVTWEPANGENLLTKQGKDALRGV